VLPSLIHPSRRPFVILAVLYSAVLTIANYAAHMAGRQTVKQIDWIVLPAADIPINIAGKLKRVDRSKLGPQVARVRREAEAAQMPCRPANASIVICSRS
jgi:hypothetical protein